MERLSGKYSLNQRVGKGTFGEVFSVEEKNIAKSSTGALHVLPRVAKIQKRSKKRDVMLENEVRAMIDLSGKGVIPQLYEVMKDDENHIIVMEHVKGLTGKALFDTRSHSLTSKRLMGLVEALCTLEENHIVHNDLTPNNIIEKKNGDHIIIDYGLSYLDAWEGGYIPETKKAGAIGTLMYASPQNLDKYPQKTSDIWSFGVIAYWALTKQFPFGRNAMTRQAHAIEWFSKNNDVCAGKRHIPNHYLQKIQEETIRGIRHEINIKCIDDNCKSLISIMKDAGVCSEGISMILKCLEVDPIERMQASELVNHPFFRHYL